MAVNSTASAGYGPIAAQGLIPSANGTVMANISGSTAFPSAQPIADVLAAAGTLQYQGTWNASTNTPTLTSSVGTGGFYYVVSVAGSTSLNGISDWTVGDWAIFNGTTTAWQKIEGGATTVPVTSVTGMGTGVQTALQANVGSAGAPVLFNGALGTPSSGTLTSATGLPISTGVSGLGTGIATALGINTGSAGAPVLFNGALGTPSSGTATNLTGTASGLTAGTASAVAVGGITGLGTGVGTFLATPSSANLATALTDETGSGAAMFATGPTIGSTTWGSIPAAGTAGRMYRVSNSGTKGSVWMDDGTIWKPWNGTAMVASLDALSAGVTTVNTVVFQYQFQAAQLRVGDRIRTCFTVIKSGTTNTCVGGFYMGTGGTTSDAALMTPTLLSAAQRQGAFIMDFRIESATTIQMLGNPTAGYGVATATASPAAVTISNISNSLYFSQSILGGASDTVNMLDGQLYLSSKAN